jgi:hypothetical protein
MISRSVLQFAALAAIIAAAVILTAATPVFAQSYYEYGDAEYPKWKRVYSYHTTSTSYQLQLGPTRGNKGTSLLGVPPEANAEWDGDANDDGLTWAPANPQPGQTVTFTLDVRQNGSSSGTRTWGLGIDENLDGTPDVWLTESQYISSYSQTIRTFDYQIPSNADGHIGVRAMIHYSTSTLQTYYGYGYMPYGEVEDYLVPIVKPDPFLIISHNGANLAHGMVRTLPTEPSREDQTITLKFENDSLINPIVVSDVRIVAHNGLYAAPSIGPNAFDMGIQGSPTGTTDVDLDYVPQGGAWSIIVMIEHTAANFPSPMTVTFSGNATYGGTYTINNGVGGADFADIGEAILALNSYGVHGPVDFVVLDGGGPYVSRQTASVTYVVRAFYGMGPANRVTFRPAYGARPVILGSGAQSGGVISPAGVFIYGGQNVWFEGIAFEAGVDGTHGIVFHGSSDTPTGDCGVHRCSFSGYRSAAVVVHSTVPTVGGQPTLASGVARIEIANNVITQTRGEVAGPVQGALYYARGAEVSVLHNSIALTDGPGPLLFHVDDGVALAELTNNILANYVGNTDCIGFPAQLAGVPDSGDGNLWYVAPGARFSSGIFPSFAVWQTLGLDGSGAMADPLFVDPHTDLRIRRSSPAINNGVDGTNIYEDFRSESRPIGSGPEVGAFEYDPTQPIIVVYDDLDASIPSGSRIAAGEVGVGLPAVFTYRITNYGAEDLELTGGQIVDVRNVQNASVQVSTQQTLRTIPPFTSTTFAVEIVGIGQGDASLTLQIANSDSGSDPFIMHIDVVVTPARPGIAVYRDPAAMLAVGATDDLGLQPISVPATFVYRIKNTGSETLQLSPGALGNFQVSNVSGATVTVRTQAPDAIAPLATVPVTLDIVPTATVFGFDVRIVNNSADPTERQFTFRVTGEGALIPALDCATAIDFGDIQVGRSSEQVLTLVNRGGSELVISSLALDSDDGTFHFVRALPALPYLGTGITLDAAGTADSTVQLFFEFVPETEGMVMGVLTIRSNDRGVANSVRTVQFIARGVGGGGAGGGSGDGCDIGRIGGSGGGWLLILVVAMVAVAGVRRRLMVP